MPSKLHALAFIIIGLAFMAHVAAGAIVVEISDSRIYHSPYEGLNIEVNINHDDYIPDGSELEIYIDDKLERAIDLSLIIDQNSYTYKSHSFSYNITADGRNDWEQYPDVTFDYSMQVVGYSGTGCSQFWSSEIWTKTEEIINAADKLKFIRNGSKTISVPPDNCKENESWSATVNTVTDPVGANVEITMRNVCGGGFYDDLFVDENGWIFREIDVDSECIGISGTSNIICYIHVFDGGSLESGFRAYGGPGGWDHGGIYRNDVYQRESLGDVEWHGESGMIRINSYDYEASYYVVYLPPNGPLACAYTDHKEDISDDWTKSRTSAGNSASYGDPYQKAWNQQELKSFLGYPACCSDCNCNQIVSQYTIEEYIDPDDAITVTFDEPTLTVTGTSTTQDLTDNQEHTIGLQDYVAVPVVQDSHILMVSLASGGEELDSDSHTFYVCDDADEDGYCEGGGDCNDTDPDVNPDQDEICDGKDNDCNGEVDEDFYGRDFECVIGEPCNDWTGSVCEGTCACTKDGTNVTCSATYMPGDLEERCLNGKDDDCDGEVDEMYDIINGTSTEGCVWRCDEGTTKPCSKNIGFCTSGERECIDGEWGPCKGARIPREETCNLALNQLPRYADDDCDGVIDNVFGGGSVEETKCGCFDGNKPKAEVCNGIDDDCDKEIDEMVCRCIQGETRFCGEDRGICKPGIQKCSQDGYWETECTGAVKPNPGGEICYNSLDDDCDGETDERCNTALTCKNEIWDLNEEGVDCGGDCSVACEYPLPWIILAFIVIGIIVTLIILEIKGKIPM